MDLHLNETPEALSYHSKTQRARVITEGWTAANLYCPTCGAPHLIQFEASRPMADFHCEHCKQQFEQKSIEKKPSHLPRKINGSGYDAMMERLESPDNPHLLLLYHKDGMINNLVLIPKYFITTSIVEKRKPTWPKGRSKEWIGSYIWLEGIPECGKIYIIKDGVPEDPKKVLELYRKTKPLKARDLESTGWLLDVLKCVEKIGTSTFTLSQLYVFESDLKKKHPENRHIKDKIRQQLQELRDKGFIEFKGRGKYRTLF